MNEVEKIEYAKSFIDKLASGINPLDETPIPDGDVANNVRISRCFFYVSSILDRQIEIEKKKLLKAKNREKAPFAITDEQLERFECSPTPITASILARKINFLVRVEIDSKRMDKLRYKKINQWLLNIGMLELKPWEDGKIRLFPTAAGEEIGLSSHVWEKYGRRTLAVDFSETAQMFVVDNIDAVINTEIIKGKLKENDEEQEDADE